MTKLDCLGSSSSGNCWILDVDGEQLIIDAGVPVERIKQALDYDFSSIRGAIITHGHTDHVKAADDLARYAVRVWHPYRIDKPVVARKFGMFEVQAFGVPHEDDVSCNGFLIRFNGKKLLYITDFRYCPYNFKKLAVDYILVECNHNDDLLEIDGRFAHSVHGHSSSITATALVAANKTPALKDVVLCHLSGRNADPARMLHDMCAVVDEHTNVCIAKTGLKFVLSE